MVTTLAETNMYTKEDMEKMRDEFAQKEKFYKWCILIIGIVAILNTINLLI